LHSKSVWMFDAIRRFIISADFYKSLTFIIASLVPILLCQYVFFKVEIGFAIALGVFYNASTNSPGSVKHRTLGMCASIVITTLATLIIGYAASNIWVIIPVLGIVTFVVSYISVYGFRASLVSLSGLLAITISFAHSSIDLSIVDYTLFVFVGGVWYLIISSLANFWNPKMYTEELLSDTMKLTGEFLATRSKLLVEKENREILNTKLFKLQAELTNKHETLRDVLLTTRQKSGLSNRIRRKLLLFIELVDMLELAVGNPVNYNKLDAIFKDKQESVYPFVELINEMALHLLYISKVIIRDEEVSVNKKILKQLEAIRKTIERYKTDAVNDRDGFYMLFNLYEYQRAQVKKIGAIEIVLNEITSNNGLNREANADIRLLTPQDYDWNKLVVNFSLKSPILRHALRLSIAMMFGFLLGNIFDVQNPYWILLTLVVIMRPSYGLTKQRMMHRIIGTFVGALLGLIIVYLVEDTLVYAVLAVASLVLAMTLVQLNYRTFAIFTTLHIVFMYALYSPDVVNVIQFRIIDTIVGGGLAILSNLFLFPSWEFMTVKDSISDTLTSNSLYLRKIEEVFDSKEEKVDDYSLSRKGSFLAVGDLNAAFQRMTQEPKSRRKYFSEIYDIVVLTNTFLSTIASLGTFVRKHNLYQHSDKFSVFVENIVDNLENANHIIRGEKLDKLHEENEIIEAKISFEKGFEELTNKYDEITLDKEVDESEISFVSKEIRQTQVILEQLSYLFDLSENLIQKINIYQDKFKKY
jgi:uncharacterized membrane protein YccC